MSEISIQARGLSKSYRLGAVRQQYRTLRDTVAEVARAPLRHLRGAKSSRRSAPDRTFWSLRDVSFDIRQGDVVGIVGKNGAGKSTLLKILARITDPTKGHAELRGRVGSLLEVGTGFHQELTGRENVYLSGAILGMSRAEIDRNFDEIVAFAEVEKFIHTPVKHYSSGMYLRLAFAVAAFLNPEILLIDEVLAVGDMAFQKKCLGKIGDVAGQGRTVLFVSHNMSAVVSLCQRALWIADGKLVADGEANEVVNAYLDMVTSEPFRYHSPQHDFTVEQVVLKNRQGEETQRFRPGDDLSVAVHYHAAKAIERPYVYVGVKSAHGSCFSANMILDGRRPDMLAGRGCLTCTFKKIPLLTQSYAVTMSIRAGDCKEKILPEGEVAMFRVEEDLASLGLLGERLHSSASKSVPVLIPYEWTHPDGRIIPVSIVRDSD